MTLVSSRRQGARGLSGWVLGSLGYLLFLQNSLKSLVTIVEVMTEV